MNPAPASTDDLRQFRKERLEKWPAEMKKLRGMRATVGYKRAIPTRSLPTIASFQAGSGANRSRNKRGRQRIGTSQQWITSCPFFAVVPGSRESRPAEFHHRPL